MKLHSDHLTVADIHAAAASASGQGAVYAEVAQQGSRSHARAFTVYLSTDHGSRRPNSGGGFERESIGKYAAMWDEWGIVLAHLFAKDENMVVGTVKRPIYANRADFDWQTDDRFVATGTGVEEYDAESGDWTPGKVHNHRWVSDPYTYGVGEQRCNGSKGVECSAVRRWRPFTRSV